MDCSQPGSSVHGDSPGKNTEVGCHVLLQGNFPTQGLNPGLLHFKKILCYLNHQGSPQMLEWVAYPFSRGSSWPRNQTRVSCMAGGFLTSWATRKALDVKEVDAEDHNKHGSCPEGCSNLKPSQRWKLTYSESESHSVVSHSLWSHGLYSPGVGILEWVAFPFSRGSSQPRDRTQVSRIAGGVFTSWATREAQEYWSGQPIPSPADLPHPGIEPGSPAWQEASLPTELSGKPKLA